MKLYKHQEEQLKFLRENKNVSMIGVESPTGSGKSVVIMERIKELFEEHPEKYQIIVTTGFNNLVFDFYEKAKDFGLNPHIIIGTNNLSCQNKSDNLFDVEKINCGIKDCDCNKFGKFKDELRNINNEHHSLIITNHSTFLLRSMRYKTFYPNTVFIDEAHTFSQFYESYLNTVISISDMNFIRKYAENTPIYKVFMGFLKQHKPIPNGIVDRLFDIIRNQTIENFGYIKDLENRIKRFTDAKKSISNFFEISPIEMTLYNFYTGFYLNTIDTNYILFTATMDKFTRLMFGLNDNYFYKEKKKIVDYTKSNCKIINRTDFKEGLEIALKDIKKQGLKRGVILSTSNDNVNKIIRDGIEGFNLYYSINTFNKGKEPKILVGSKRFFQGIDISGLDFVLLNKIPFPKYDEKFIANSNYIKHVMKIDPWENFTIPKTINTLIQASGRLWRGKNDFGTFYIIDSKLVDKFNYILNEAIEKPREGIKISDLDK